MGWIIATFVFGFGFAFIAGIFTGCALVGVGKSYESMKEDDE